MCYTITNIEVIVKRVITIIEITVRDGKLYFKSEYNRDILTFMRSRPVRYWNKVSRQWELPESDLELVLTTIKDYEYTIDYPDNKTVSNNSNKLEDTKQSIDIQIPDWYEFKTKPYSYQLEGISYGLQHPKFLLGDEPGLGKSKMSLDISQIRKQEGVKHVLIIACVNGLKYNWQKEVEVHTNERAYILGTRLTKKGKERIGSNEERLQDVESIGNGGGIDNYFYYITNIETLRYKRVEQVPLKTKKNGVQRFRKKTTFPIVEALQKQIKDGNISIIVCDEIHRIKNPSSIQSQALLSLHADNMIALTGTPIKNSPEDIYTILKWLGYEEHSYYQFEKHYCIKGGFGNHQIVGYKNLHEIQATLDRCMLRRLKSDVLDLPEKIYMNDYIEMTKEQAKLYEEVKEFIVDNIDKIKLSPNPLTNLIRLRQVTGNPQIISSSVKSNPKYDRMLELIEDVVQQGKKCIVFSNWTAVLNPAFELAQNNGYNPAIYTGENTKTREQEKQRFMTDESCKVFFGTIGAMGVGLTLTAATTAIFLDEPWSRADKDQCEDRIHRIGTSESPNIITLMCKGTIDERINDIVYRKGKMSDILIDKEQDILSNPKLLNYLLS